VNIDSAVSNPNVEEKSVVLTSMRSNVQSPIAEQQELAERELDNLRHQHPHIGDNINTYI
jgi:hypothetical protein